MKIMLTGIFAPDTNYSRDLSVYFNTILGKNDRLLLCGKRTERVNNNKNPKVEYIWRSGYKFMFDILDYANKHKPDVIHLQHEFKTYGGLETALLFPLLLLILKLKGYPIVVTVHGIVAPQQVDDEFLVNFNVKPGLVSKWMVLIFFHYVYISIILLSDRITVHAPMLKEILGNYFPPFRNKIVVIEHGIREIKNLSVKKNLFIEKQFPIIRDKKIILVFGHFSPRKGYEDLLLAFKQVLERIKKKDWLIALVGDVQPEFQAYWDKIVNLIEEYKLKKNVLMTGFVQDLEIDEFFKFSKVVLIPAIVSFNTSGALSLALAYKKPLLVANVKPLAAEISSNDFGLLYDKKGKYSLEKQLEKFMSDEKLYEELSYKLKQTVGRRYWTVIAKEHFDLYKTLIKK